MTLLAPAVAVVTAMLVGASSCSTSSGINNQPQPTTGATATATASAAPLAPVAHLGDSVVITGNNSEKLSVQLVKVVDPTSASDQFSQPSQGKHYIAIQFRLTNTGTVAYSDSPDNDAKVLDAQGQSFSPDFTDSTAGASFAGNQVNIAPTASQLGFITFQIPDGDKPAKIQFTTDSGFGQTGEWVVA